MVPERFVMTASVPSALDRALTETDDASADIHTSYSMTVGDVFMGTVGDPGDIDCISFEMTDPGLFTFSMRGSSSGSGTLRNPFLRLYNSDGHLVGYIGDGGAGRDARIETELTEGGTYFLYADGAGGSGSYEISIDYSAPTLGTEAADILIGSRGEHDVTYGLGGDDLLRGLGGGTCSMEAMAMTPSLGALATIKSLAVWDRMSYAEVADTITSGEKLVMIRFTVGYMATRWMVVTAPIICTAASKMTHYMARREMIGSLAARPTTDCSAARETTCSTVGRVAIY